MNLFQCYSICLDDESEWLDTAHSEIFWCTMDILCTYCDGCYEIFIEYIFDWKDKKNEIFLWWECIRFKFWSTGNLPSRSKINRLLEAICFFHQILFQSISIFMPILKKNFEHLVSRKILNEIIIRVVRSVLF